MVLVLSTLNTLLAQLLSLPELHTALLLSPEGQLISVASDPSRPKDKARVVAGVSSEIWQETREQGYGTVESEVSSDCESLNLPDPYLGIVGSHPRTADCTGQWHEPRRAATPVAIGIELHRRSGMG